MDTLVNGRHTAGKIHYEPQIWSVAGVYYYVVTISAAMDNYWTSQPARLQATNLEDAKTEVSGQLLALARVLS